MQLLRDNLTLWTADMNHDEEAAKDPSQENDITEPEPVEPAA